jgi:hypothetical protein
LKSPLNSTPFHEVAWISGSIDPRILYFCAADESDGSAALPASKQTVGPSIRLKSGWDLKPLWKEAERKSPVPNGNRIPVVQPIDSHYND